MTDFLKRVEFVREEHRKRKSVVVRQNKEFESENEKILFVVVDSLFFSDPTSGGYS